MEYKSLGAGTWTETVRLLAAHFCRVSFACQGDGHRRGT